jgi:hypothetical protein
LRPLNAIGPRTDLDRLDLDALLDVRDGGVVRLLVLEHLLAAQRIDKRGPARARGTADHQAELDTLLDILLSARLDSLQAS